jgi:tRNA A37 threonylcarbamoyladenosine synthetase subunit TsaC/SUA5/YrdC
MDSQALYLVQTDTTVGFLTQDSALLSKVKNRPYSKAFVSVYSDFKAFKENKNRISNLHKNYVRASKQTTFVSKNRASRIVNDSKHHDFLKKFDWFFSSSANQNTKVFKRDFALDAADIIVEDARGLYENKPSCIIKLSQTREVKLR